jgi:hypothetical protein
MHFYFVSVENQCSGVLGQRQMQYYMLSRNALSQLLSAGTETGGDELLSNTYLTVNEVSANLAIRYVLLLEEKLTILIYILLQAFTSN